MHCLQWVSQSPKKVVDLCFPDSRFNAVHVRATGVTPLTRLSRDCGIATLSSRERVGGQKMRSQPFLTCLTQTGSDVLEPTPRNPKMGSQPSPRGRGWSRVAGPGEGSLVARLPENSTQNVRSFKKQGFLLRTVNFAAIPVR